MYVCAWALYRQVYLNVQVLHTFAFKTPEGHAPTVATQLRANGWGGGSQAAAGLRKARGARAGNAEPAVGFRWHAASHAFEAIYYALHEADVGLALLGLSDASDGALRTQIGSCRVCGPFGTLQIWFAVCCVPGQFQALRTQVWLWARATRVHRALSRGP